MSERILMKGNEAVGEAAVRAGCRLYFGYPITPASEIAEYMAYRLPQVGGIFIQASLSSLRRTWSMVRQQRESMP